VVSPYENRAEKGRLLIVVKHPKELMSYVGQRLGTSDWMTISQDMINRFADVTGDDNWIHVDLDRASRDLPGGKPIAHGFLTLSLTPILGRQIMEVQGARQMINYGTDNVRFPATVQSGGRIRLSLDLTEAAERADRGIKFTLKSIVEAEGVSKPVCVFDKQLLIYPAGP